MRHIYVQNVIMAVFELGPLVFKFFFNFYHMAVFSLVKSGGRFLSTFLIKPPYDQLLSYQTCIIFFKALVTV